MSTRFFWASFGAGIAESRLKICPLQVSVMFLYMYLLVAQEIFLDSPILSGIRLDSVAASVPSSLSSRLSTATCVETQKSTRFRRETSCKTSSHRTVVLPDPGGPSKKAKSGVPSAFSTNSRCNADPSRSSDQ